MLKDKGIIHNTAYISLVCILFALGGCSTTRTLPDGTFRLAENKVAIVGTKDIKISDISPYIKQSPNNYFVFGWNPFLNIYNWRDGSGKGLDKIWAKIGTPPVQFSYPSMTGSLDNIRNHLEYLGYYGSEVSSRIDTVRRLVKVTYTVKPGRRYGIDSIEYVLPEDSPDFRHEFKLDLDKSLVKTGGFLSEQLLENESDRSAAYFNELGYYDFSKNNYFFEVDTLGGAAALKYVIKNYNRNESPADASPLVKYRFGNVSVTRSSNIRFRDNVIKRLNKIHSGNLYSVNTVNTTYSRLAALKLFNGVAVGLTPTDSCTIDCNIRLSESSVQGIKTDLEFSTNSSGLLGLAPKLSWYHKNIFHGAEWLTIDLAGNFQFMPRSNIKSTELSVSGSLSFPRFIGLPETVFKKDVPRTEIKMSYSYQNRPEYRRNIASVSYGYNGSFNSSFFYQLNPFRCNFVKLYDMSDEFLDFIIKNPSLVDMFIDHIDMGVGGMLYYTTNSDLVPKTSYRYARLNFDLSGNFLKLCGLERLFGLDYSNYIRGELSLGRTLRFGQNDGQALALRLVAGAGYDLSPFTNSLPYEKLFFVGGASSMRGWQSRTLGPGSYRMDQQYSTGLIPSQSGDMRLELDLEYRFRMFWKLEGALFAETGNIWNINKGGYDFNIKNFYESLAADWGAGLRVNLNFLLLRLDLGLKLHDPSRELGQRWLGPDKWFTDNGYAIHFGVGYPF